MPFDPDAYLNQKLGITPTEQPAFDPDAYLAAKTPVEEPSQFQSFARGTAQGATMGFADEITGAAEGLLNLQGRSGTERFSVPIQESRAAYGAAQEANPVTYGAGELTGGIASALAIPGAGPATLAGKVGLGALGGAAAGLGYSDIKDLSGAELFRGGKEALKGAAIGGAIPGVLGVGKKLIPGAKGSIVNKPFSEGTRLFGTSKESAKTVKEMLDKPELYETAREGKKSVLDHVDDFYKPLAEETITKIKGAVGKEYQEGVKAAGERMVKDPEILQNLKTLDTHVKSAIVGKSQQELKEFPEFYKGKAKDVINETNAIINNKYPGAIGKDVDNAISETQKRITQLSKTGASGKEQLAQETQKLADLTKVSSMAQVQRLLDARRNLDQAINYKKLDWSPSDKQRELFSNMRKEIDELIKANPEIAKVDKFYSEYAESFKPLAKKLTNRETGDVEVNNVINFLKGGAGDAATAFNKQSLDKADAFIRKEFSNDKELIAQWNKFHSNARPFQLFSSLQGVKQTTGEFTGRANLPAMAAGVAGGLLGPAAAGVAAVAAPLMSPVKYLEVLHQLRKPAAKIDKVFKGKQTLVGTSLGADIGVDDEQK